LAGKTALRTTNGPPKPKLRRAGSPLWTQRAPAGILLAGRDGQRPVPRVRVRPENERLLFRRRFIGVLCISAAAHRQPRRVHPVVRPLVAFPDVAPPDGAVAVAA